MSTVTKKNTSYAAKDIVALEGLEPVRKRPGMYIGGVGMAGLHHLVWEILDNSVDEAMNGHASEITVQLHKDGQTITVSDNGRGIPVDKHPKTKKPALEMVLTVLHAGGKFDGHNYKTAGGLHGVGASVVNALSKKLVAVVRRDGSQYRMEFAKGQAKTRLQRLKGTVRGSGTTITFTPDPTIFPKIDFDPTTIRQRLEIVSFLHRGVKVTFVDDVNGKKVTFLHEQGIVDYLGQVLQERHAKPIHEAPFTFHKAADERIELAMQWTESTDEHVRSYVNGIPTGNGGTHENGFRAALTKAVRNYFDTHNLIPRGVKITHEDIREGLVCDRVDLCRRATVSRPNQRPAEQPGGSGDDRRGPPPCPGTMDEQQPQRGRRNCRADHHRRPSPSRFAGGVRFRVEESRRQTFHATRQTQRLPGLRPRSTLSCSSWKAIRRAAAQSKDEIGTTRRSCRCVEKC